MHQIFLDLAEKYNGSFFRDKDIWFDGNAYFPLYNYESSFEIENLVVQVNCEYRQSDFSRKRGVVFNTFPKESCTVQVRCTLPSQEQWPRFQTRKRSFYDLLLKRRIVQSTNMIAFCKDVALHDFLMNNELLCQIYSPDTFVKYSVPTIDGFYKSKDKSYKMETVYMFEQDGIEIIDQTIDFYLAVKNYLNVLSKV